ncbi:SCO6745 family protein [Rhodococcus daqingensis]|uniref:EvbL n=1 Tax=Rhodococcus daqingensis TaxID=2479363 RepID=A0ABW2RW41_9NOCA
MTVANAVKDQIQQIGGGFMFSREAKEFGRSTGVDGFIGPYMRGRCGVLGEVDADVVTAAAGFFPAAGVRAAWESVAMPAAEAARGYALAAQRFGVRKLDSFDGAERLAELMEAVAVNADPAGVPLFAGWRAVPLPEDPRARLLQLTHVLRELRGGLHLIAVRSQDVSPRDAVLIAGSPLASGPDQAALYGWPAPYDAPNEDVRARWVRAEEITDQLTSQAFDVLDESEGKELVTLLADAYAGVFAPR